MLLAQLNAGGGFAGHTDWRLPTRDELQTIADYADASSPVVAAVFDAGCTGSCAPTTCSCTAPGPYWTDDLVASISGNAWILDFSDGRVLTSPTPGTPTTVFVPCAETPDAPPGRPDCQRTVQDGGERRSTCQHVGSENLRRRNA